MTEPVNSPAHIMALWLVQLDIGGALGGSEQWGVFVGSMPDADDANDLVICVYDSGAGTTEKAVNPDAAASKSGIQVRVRAKDYPSGWKKAQAVEAAMDRIDGQGEQISITDEEDETLSYQLNNFTRSTGVVPIGAGGQTAENRNHEFTVSGRLSLTER